MDKDALQKLLYWSYLEPEDWESYGELAQGSGIPTDDPAAGFQKNLKRLLEDPTRERGILGGFPDPDLQSYKRLPDSLSTEYMGKKVNRGFLKSAVEEDLWEMATKAGTEWIDVASGERRSTIDVLINEAKGLLNPAKFFESMGRGTLNAFGPLGIFPHSKQGLTGDPEEYFRDFKEQQELKYWLKYGS